MHEDSHEILMQSLTVLWLVSIGVGSIIIWWIRRWDKRRQSKVIETKTYSQRLAERLAAPKRTKRKVHEEMGSKCPRRQQSRSTHGDPR